MAGLADYGIDLNTLQSMYDQWCAGAKKSELERRYLDRPQSHGKLFSTLVREHLGYETERRSSLASERDELKREVRRLRAVLERSGIDWEEGR